MFKSQSIYVLIGLLSIFLQDIYGLVRSYSFANVLNLNNERMISPIYQSKQLTSFDSYQHQNQKLSGNIDGEISFHNEYINSFSKTVYGHKGRVTSVKVSDCGRFSLSGSTDATAILWDTETKQPLRRFIDGNKQITAVDLSRDTQLVLTASTDGYVRIFSNISGVLINKIKVCETGAVSLAEFSKYSDDIIAVGHDSVIKKYSMDGLVKLEYKGHKLPVTAIVYSNDDNYMYSASNDNTIKKWDLHTGELIYTYLGNTAPVVKMSISKGCNYLISSSKDLVLRVWDLATDKLIKSDSLCIPKSDINSAAPNTNSDSSTTDYLEGVLNIYDNYLNDNFHLDEDSQVLNYPYGQ